MDVYPTEEQRAGATHAVDAYPAEEQRTGAADAGETWMFYPNDLPKRSAYSGDTRWALTPFLAHQVSASLHTPFL